MGDFYKRYREILESDIIHVRRADGRNLDGILHVNPALPIKGLAMIYNPGDAPLTQDITLPLYYAGSSGTALVAERDGTPIRMTLGRHDRVTVRANVAARSNTWFVIR